MSNFLFNFTDTTFSTIVMHNFETNTKSPTIFYSYFSYSNHIYVKKIIGIMRIMLLFSPDMPLHEKLLIMNSPTFHHSSVKFKLYSFRNKVVHWFNRSVRRSALRDWFYDSFLNSWWRCWEVRASSSPLVAENKWALWQSCTDMICQSYCLSIKYIYFIYYSNVKVFIILLPSYLHSFERKCLYRKLN